MLNFLFGLCLVIALCINAIAGTTTLMSAAPRRTYTVHAQIDVNRSTAVISKGGYGVKIFVANARTSGSSNSDLSVGQCIMDGMPLAARIWSDSTPGMKVWEIPPSDNGRYGLITCDVAITASGNLGSWPNAVVEIDKDGTTVGLTDVDVTGNVDGTPLSRYVGYQFIARIPQPTDSMPVVINYADSVMLDSSSTKRDSGVEVVSSNLPVRYKWDSTLPINVITGNMIPVGQGQQVDAMKLIVQPQKQNEAGLTSGNLRIEVSVP
ncbi:hypothetical protein [Escherichia coli]|uniref:hypothetical protein n=2 Tax=Escherichia coli TaxID=562 RepID=UPI0018E58D39|nr:hypothetical protein [Escherichia coli]